jgi:hypothetical protein
MKVVKGDFSDEIAAAGAHAVAAKAAPKEHAKPSPPKKHRK